MRMPKVGDRVVCIEDESLGTVVYLTAGGSPEIKFDDGSHGTYILREFAELFGYTTPPAQEFICSTGLCHYKPAAPVQSLPFGVGGGLVAIKTLLSRDPCVHANIAIEMIDAILKEHPAAQPAPDLQAELNATNKQVEILSDALAESRREVAALKSVQEPVAYLFTNVQSGDIEASTNPDHKEGEREMWYREPLVRPLAAPVQEPVCHICKGTGEMDHGGTYPWGEAINIPCECTTPPAAAIEPVVWQHIESAPKDGTRILCQNEKGLVDICEWTEDRFTSSDDRTFGGHLAYTSWTPLPYSGPTLPAAHRPWVGLTDEEIEQGCKESWVTEQAFQSAVWWAEAKLKERNT